MGDEPERGTPQMRRVTGEEALDTAPQRRSHL
jgi:hypothetical protein